MATLATIVNDGNYIVIPEWDLSIFKGTVKTVLTKPKSVIIKTIDSESFSLDSREFEGYPDGATLAATILEYLNLYSRGLPAGGLEDQVLAKASDSDFDLEWATDPGAAASVPDGGVTDQVLTKLSNTDQDIDWVTPDVYVPPSHVITVAKAGGDFTDIKSAIDAITDNSSVIRYTISVASGEYIVDNSLGPIQLKSFCNISAVGIRSVVLKPQDPTQTMFIGENFSYLEGIVFSGNTGSAAYILEHSLPGNTIMKTCVFRDCSNGVLNSGADSIVEVTDLAINNPAGSTTINAINIQAGKATIDTITVRIGARIDNLLIITGNLTQTSLHNLLSISPIVTNAIQVTDGATVVGTTVNIGYGHDGLIIYGDNTDVRLDAVKIMYCQNDGFRIENTGTNQHLALFAATVSQCVGLNFNVLNPTARVSGNGFTELNNSYVIPGAKFYAYLLDITEGDEGLNILGELHVGSPEIPAESVFGGGDSYTRGIKVFTEDSVNTFVDVTDAAVSASGSTLTFPGVTAGNAIYVSSTLNNGADFLNHYGVKTSLQTAAVVGTGSIITEYFNGVAWVELNTMETGSYIGYYPHAKNIFQHAGSYQIRYNSELSKDNWTKNDPVGYGTDLYWVRFKIESLIITAPIIEQIKVHTSRFEVNSDGWVEYFGTARPIGQLSLNMTLGRPFEGNMQSQTLYISEDIGVGFTTNKFTATTDKLGVSGFLPFDMDTSTPVLLAWSGSSSVSDTMEWTIRWAWGTEGDALLTTEPGPIVNSRVTTITKDTIVDTVNVFSVPLDLSELVSRRDGGFGDGLWVSIQPSIMNGTFSLSGSQALYTKWCEGGHI